MDIQKTRKSLGLTLQEAADLVGITREGVRLAEAGEAPKAAGKLAKAYRAEAKREVKAAFKQKGDSQMRITFDISIDKDGDIQIRYEGYHPNTDYVADLIVKAIAAAEGSVATLVSKK
jgi:transcriptional regulator with XRE-family HTH domain